MTYTNPSNNTMEVAKPMASHDERGSQVDAQEAGTGLRRVYNVWTGRWPSTPPLIMPPLVRSSVCYLLLTASPTASAYQVLMMASWTCNIVLYSTVFDLGGPMMLVYST